MKEKERIYELLRDPSKVRIGHRDALVEVQSKFPSFTKIQYLLDLIDAREAELAPSADHQKELLTVREQWEHDPLDFEGIQPEEQVALSAESLAISELKKEEEPAEATETTAPSLSDERISDSHSAMDEESSQKDVAENPVLEERVEEIDEEKDKPSVEEPVQSEANVQPKNSYEENLIKLGLGHLIGLNSMDLGVSDNLDAEKVVDVSEVAEPIPTTETTEETKTSETTAEQGVEQEAAVEDLTSRAADLEAVERTKEEVSNEKEEDLAIGNDLPDEVHTTEEILNAESEEVATSESTSQTEIESNEPIEQEVLAEKEQASENQVQEDPTDGANTQQEEPLGAESQETEEVLETEVENKESPKIYEQEEESSDLAVESLVAETENFAIETPPTAETPTDVEVQEQKEALSENQETKEEVPLLPEEAQSQEAVLAVSTETQSEEVERDTLDPNTKRSLDSWLDLGPSGGLLLGKEDSSGKKKQEKIIAEFLEKSPKIKVNKAKEPKACPMDGELEEGFRAEWVTETLADIYMQQKKYDLAIQSFEVLGLKYPEKSTYFAGRIEEARALQQK